MGCVELVAHVLGSYSRAQGDGLQGRGKLTLAIRCCSDNSRAELLETPSSFRPSVSSAPSRTPADLSTPCARTGLYAEDWHGLSRRMVHILSGSLPACPGRIGSQS